MSEGEMGGATIVRFPVVKRAPRVPSIEAVIALTPARSLVKGLLEREDLPERDLAPGISRAFGYLARVIKIGGGSDDATFRLRDLVDAQVRHALELCEAFQGAADRLTRLEVKAAQGGQATGATLHGLQAARREFSNRAIAARAAADAALGAVEALVGHVRLAAGLAVPVEFEPEQLLLFAAAG